MKKPIPLFTCTLLLCVLTAAAQEDKHDKNDRVESYKIAFITEKLDLTPKEAAAFWPVYNEYSDQIKKLRAKDKDRLKTYKEKSAATDADSEKFISDHLLSKQQEMDLAKKYIAEFKKILPVTKVARLVTLEQDFKMQLLKKLKEPKDK